MIEEYINELEGKIYQLEQKVDFICSTLPQALMVFARQRPIKEFDSLEHAEKWISDKGVYSSIYSIKSVPKGMYETEEK